MKCILCNNEIKNYNEKFHHLKINDEKSVDICSLCMDNIVKWQSTILADLFPTKAMKKMNRNNH